MSFDQSPIYGQTVAREGDTLAVAWLSSAPAGSTYQLYVDRSLAWYGTVTNAVVPWPAGTIRVDIGVVDPADATTDYSSLLTVGSRERAELAWKGGTYLSPTLDRFAIYQSPSPGAAIDYTAPVATVRANSAIDPSDGFGLGGFGSGGWGEAASDYNWTSGVLGRGSWSFGVVPIDAAGNPGVSSEVTIAIVGPPNPPGIRPTTGVRAPIYAYTQSSRVAVLTWEPSPP